MAVPPVRAAITIGSHKKDAAWSFPTSCCSFGCHKKSRGSSLAAMNMRYRKYHCGLVGNLSFSICNHCITVVQKQTTLLERKRTRRLKEIMSFLTRSNALKHGILPSFLNKHLYLYIPAPYKIWNQNFNTKPFPSGWLSSFYITTSRDNQVLSLPSLTISRIFANTLWHGHVPGRWHFKVISYNIMK